MIKLKWVYEWRLTPWPKLRMV